MEGAVDAGGAAADVAQLRQRQTRPIPDAAPSTANGLP